MAYVKYLNMELEWENDEDYQRCLTMIETFKLHHAKIWEKENENSTTK